MTPWLRDPIFKRFFLLLLAALLIGEGCAAVAVRSAPAGGPWLAYAVRFIAIGLAAWAGSHWLVLAWAAPMREPPQAEPPAWWLAAISHELRTPLARLRLRLESTDGMPHAEACIAEVRAMDETIGSLLQLIRPEPSAAPNPRLDLRALLLALTDDLAELGEPVDAAGIDPGGAPVIVSAPPDALRAACAALIRHAVQRGGSARIGLAVASGATQAQVLIDDDGPRLPALELKPALQPLHRAAAGSQSEPPLPGGGLGVYVASNLAQRFNGRLALTNRAEGGLRAELAVPLA